MLSEHFQRVSDFAMRASNVFAMRPVQVNDLWLTFILPPHVLGLIIARKVSRKGTEILAANIYLTLSLCQATMPGVYSH